MAKRSYTEYCEPLYSSNIMVQWSQELRSLTWHSTIKYQSMFLSAPNLWIKSPMFFRLYLPISLNWGWGIQKFSFSFNNPYLAFTIHRVTTDHLHVALDSWGRLVLLWTSLLELLSLCLIDFLVFIFICFE